MNKSPLVIATIILASSAAYAEPLKERGGYVGLSYGATSLEDDDFYSGERINDNNFLNSDLDDKGQAWQIYGGYRFMKYFAVEGRYTGFGDYTAEFDGKLFGESFSGEEKIEFSALTAHAVGIYPFGQSGFDIYGQLGVGGLKYDAKFKSNIGNSSEDDTVGTISFGAGARYTPPQFQAITVQLGYDVYVFQGDLGDDDSANMSLSMAKLGVQYNF